MKMKKQAKINFKSSFCIQMSLRSLHWLWDFSFTLRFFLYSTSLWQLDFEWTLLVTGCL
jgi:hypothetical protein